MYLNLCGFSRTMPMSNQIATDPSRTFPDPSRTLPDPSRTSFRLTRNTNPRTTARTFNKVNCICHTNEMINNLCGMTKACRSLGYERVYLPLCKCRIHSFISEDILFSSLNMSAHYPYIIQTPAYKSMWSSGIIHNIHITTSK